MKLLSSSDPYPDTLFGSIHGIFILAFCLTFFLAYILTFYLSGMDSDILCGIYSDILSGILSSIYSDILSGIFSGIHSGIFLASILTFSLTCFPAFYLASILPFFRAFYLTFSLASGWGPAVPTEMWRPRLRPHWDLALAVEVRVPTDMKSGSAHHIRNSQLRSQATGREGEEKATLIKSRDPHLAGGENIWKQAVYPHSIPWNHHSCCWNHHFAEIRKGGGVAGGQKLGKISRWHGGAPPVIHKPWLQPMYDWRIFLFCIYYVRIYIYTHKIHSDTLCVTGLSGNLVWV